MNLGLPTRNSDEPVFGESYRKNPEYGKLSFVYRTLDADLGKPMELTRIIQPPAQRGEKMQFEHDVDV
jgi:hypothetical protein